MTEPIYFVIEQRAGREFAAVYHDVLPDRLTRKGSTSMVYHMRLDRLPDCDKWLAMPTSELYRRYLFARDHGKLVQNTADAPRQKEPTTRKLGERWQPPAPTWDQSQPFERPHHIGGVNIMAPAYIPPGRGEGELDP